MVEKEQVVKKYEETRGNAIKSNSKSSAVLDWNKYFVLMPQPSRYYEKKLTITEKGDIRLNSALQKSIQSKEIEFIFSKDYREILLNENGKNPHKLTKAGTARNREIVERLKKNKIRLPVSYIVKWNDAFGMWYGIINMSNKA